MKNARLASVMPLALAAILGAAALSRASEPTLSLSRTVITDSYGRSRVLFEIPSLQEYREEWVSSATLILDLPPGSFPGEVELLVDAVATPWGGSATWSSPWTHPGGDVEGQTGDGTTLAAGPSPSQVRLDVTTALRGMVEGDLGEYGLIVYPSDPAKAGFTAAESQVLASANGTLALRVRSLTARGYHGGAKALLDRKRNARLLEDHPR